MDNHNPYAPSRATLAGAAVTPDDGSGTWRDGAVLVLTPDASLPGRCVRCNEPSAEPTKSRKLYWHSPWIYILIAVNILIYAIVAVIVRKKAIVAPGLCSEHKKRRRYSIAIAWTLLIAGFVVLIGGTTDESPGAALAGVALILAAIVVSIAFTRIVRAKKIDAQYVRLKGCGPAFLDSMPQFPG